MGGQNYHYLGSLFPNEGTHQVYSQFYVHDTDNENTKPYIFIKVISSHFIQNELIFYQQ